MEIASIAGGAAPVVNGLTAGYETTLGPTFGGRDLSGGEWQRFATARSFMRETHGSLFWMNRRLPSIAR